MVNINRAQRIADLMRRELGRFFLQEVKDPRIKLVSITDLQVSRDLSHAKVFYTLVDKEKDLAASSEALNKASGFLRKRIAEELNLRATPKLSFIYDDAMEHGRHISSLIDAAIAEDKKNTNTNEDD